MAFPYYKRSGKYNAKKTTILGEEKPFDSAGEARQWNALRARQLRGEIKDLERQPVYELVWNGVLICRYKPDFRYFEWALLDVPIDGDNWGWRLVVEDYKGVKTEAFVIKEKAMLACFGIKIRLSGLRKRKSGKASIPKKKTPLHT